MSYSSFSSNYNNPIANLGSGLANAESGAKNAFARFRNNKVVSGTTDFLYSNSLVAKFCFFVLVVILFIIFLRLGSRFIQWVFEPTRNPILIDGLKDGKKLKIVPQDPKVNGAKPVLRSVNQREGLEFTYKQLDADFTREELFEQFPGARTFPQIKFDGENIGGYDSLVAKLES